MITAWLRVNSVTLDQGNSGFVPAGDRATSQKPPKLPKSALRLTKAKRDLDLTGAQLADILDVTRETISRYETGRLTVPTWVWAVLSVYVLKRAGWITIPYEAD